MACGVRVLQPYRGIPREEEGMKKTARTHTLQREGMVVYKEGKIMIYVCECVYTQWRAVLYINNLTTL